MSETNGQPAEAPQVLMVVDDDVFDRLGSIVRHLCIGMVDEAVRLTVLARREPGEAEDAIGPARIVHVPPGRWPWRHLRRPVDSQRVLALTGSERYHIVHCLSVDLARWARDWARAWQSTLIVHVTDLIDVAEIGRLEPDERTVAVATTEPLAETLRQQYAVLDDRIHVIPLGMPAGSDVACLARPERIPTAVITTPLTRDSGLEVVFRALHMVVDAEHDVQLFVLAAGPAERALRHLADQLEIRAHVTFAGRLGDWSTLREAMRGSDFLILPTGRRRFTVSTLTAMANGLCVLAPTGTIGDYLIDGDTAALYDPDSSKELADKWIGLLEHADEARRLAHGALEHIRTHHQASAMAAAVAQLYRDVRAAQRNTQSAPARALVGS
jgi:glycosyltransferase involved in cell wall biosynthesis